MVHRPLPKDNLFLTSPAYFPDRRHCPPAPACGSSRNFRYFPNYFQFPVSSGASRRSSGSPSVDTWLRFLPASPDPDSFVQTGSGYRIPCGTGHCSRSHYISYLYMTPYKSIAPFLFPINLCSPVNSCYNGCCPFLRSLILSRAPFSLPVSAHIVPLSHIL